MIDGFIRNARVLMRAEAIVAEIKLRQAFSSLALVIVAGVIGLFGLGMLNVAGFFYFSTLWGPVGGAGCVAGIDFVLAFLLLAGAGRAAGSGRDLELALQIRQSAMDGLENEAANLQGEFPRLMSDLRGLRGAAGRPMDSVLSGLILPLAGVLLKAMRSRGNKTDS